MGRQSGAAIAPTLTKLRIVLGKKFLVATATRSTVYRQRAACQTNQVYEEIVEKAHLELINKTLEIRTMKVLSIVVPRGASTEDQSFTLVTSQKDDGS